jgi:hypothetical protein
MWTQLIRYFVANQVEKGLKDAVRPLAPYLRKLVFGAGLIATGLILSSVAFLLVFLALFFHFAALPYVAAAGWTALCVGGLSIVIIGIGISLLKKPRD